MKVRRRHFPAPNEMSFPGASVWNLRSLSGTPEMRGLAALAACDANDPTAALASA
jgi:hypothetical protein